MVHSHEGPDEWSSLSSVDSLSDLSVPTPPPSKGNGSGGAFGSGFRRLSARTAADIAKSASATAAMAERSHGLPSEKEIKAERYRYAPSDREIWRPAIEQLSQKLSEQQHEIWELQAKLRDEAQRYEQLAKAHRAERKEHKEVVSALTSELSTRRESETAAQADVTQRHKSELEGAWKRCAELEQQRRVAEEDAAAQKQTVSKLKTEINDLQTQIAGLKLIAAQPFVEQSRNGQTEQASAAMTQQNADLQAEVQRLREEVKASVAASQAPSNEVRHEELLAKEIETLKASNSALQETSKSLRDSLDSQTQHLAYQIKKAEDAAWEQASHLAAEKIAEAAKRTEMEISRLNEKTESQAVIVAAQKEFIAMANSQLDYMRSLLGESLQKVLSRQERPSPESARKLQPSPLHSSIFRPSPPPPNLSRSHSSTRPSSSNDKLSSRRASEPLLETPKAHVASPSLPGTNAAISGRSSAYTPPLQTATSTSEPAESSLDSVSTATERYGRSHAPEWMSQTPAEKYPLQQSTVNHSTSMASAILTRAASDSSNATPSQRKDSAPGVSFLDALYERLSKGRMTREELEGFENIYDARSEIMAERPGMGLDAKNMVSELRPQVSRKHAAVVSRMADELA